MAPMFRGTLPKHASQRARRIAWARDLFVSSSLGRSVLLVSVLAHGAILVAGLSVGGFVGGAPNGAAPAAVALEVNQPPWQVLVETPEPPREIRDDSTESVLMREIPDPWTRLDEAAEAEPVDRTFFGLTPPPSPAPAAWRPLERTAGCRVRWTPRLRSAIRPATVAPRSPPVSATLLMSPRSPENVPRISMPRSPRVVPPRPSIITPPGRMDHQRHDAALEARMRAKGWAGTRVPIDLEVTLDAAGRPDRVTVIRSSGRRDIDETVRRAVLFWGFTPKRENGRPIASRLIIPIIL